MIVKYFWRPSPFAFLVRIDGEIRPMLFYGIKWPFIRILFSNNKATAHLTTKMILKG